MNRGVFIVAFPSSSGTFILAIPAERRKYSDQAFRNPCLTGRARGLVRVLALADLLRELLAEAGTSASTSVHGPWQITATGLPTSKNERKSSSHAGLVPG
jgi:hypothetical protein